MIPPRSKQIATTKALRMTWRCELSNQMKTMISKEKLISKFSSDTLRFYTRIGQSYYGMVMIVPLLSRPEF